MQVVRWLTWRISVRSNPVGSELGSVLDAKSVIPVTYMNSTAAIKSFTGEHGGSACTSSNAEAVLKWAFTQGKKVLFLPDEHLGRNTAFRMGIALDEMTVWDPYQEMGGNTAEDLRRAKVILWKGYCSVHQRFLPEHVVRVRQEYPGIRVIVHPECRFEVAQAADEIGSTEGIIRSLVKSPPGSRWAVGTELHLVNRLAKEMLRPPDHFARFQHVRLHHDVSHHAGASVVGAGKSGCWQRRESDFSGRTYTTVRENCA